MSKLNTIQIIEGDLLDANTKYIVHQCNIITTRAKHLAWSMFQRYPYANVYHQRQGQRSIPGTIQISKDPTNQGPSVIAFYAQRYPGSSKYSNDTYPMRKQWFEECLKHLATLPDLENGVSFPWEIGCGAAGANWQEYYSLLEEFSKNHPDAKVYIYRLKTSGTKRKKSIS